MIIDTPILAIIDIDGRVCDFVEGRVGRPRMDKDSLEDKVVRCSQRSLADLAYGGYGLREDVSTLLSDSHSAATRRSLQRQCQRIR